MAKTLRKKCFCSESDYVLIDQGQGGGVNDANVRGKVLAHRVSAHRLARPPSKKKCIAGIDGGKCVKIPAQCRGIPGVLDGGEDPLTFVALITFIASGDLSPLFRQQMHHYQ